MHKSSWTAITAALYSSFCLATTGCDSSGSAKRADGGAVAGPTVVRALGRLEPEGGVVSVAATAGLRIQQICVKEGDWVKKGGELAILEGNAERRRELALIDAQIREAAERLAAEQDNEQSQRADLALQRRRIEEIEAKEIAGLQSSVSLLEKSCSLAEKQLARLHSVEGSTAIPSEQIERQEIQVNAARRDLDEAKLGLEKLKLSHQINLEDLKNQEKKIASGARRAKAALPMSSLAEQRRLAQSRLKSTVVTSPIEGDVLKILVRPGENAAGQPILQLGDVRKMTAVAEVYETEVLDIKKGQKASVVILRDVVPGKVESVGRMVSRNFLFGVDPTAKSDARIVEVRIALDDSAKASRFTNMQVDVEIELGSAPGTAAR